MPTVMNVNEAKTNFSGILSNVENNLVTVTIMRYGHPIARIVPIKARRVIRKNPRLSFKISDKDLFSDDSGLWEACNG